MGEEFLSENNVEVAEPQEIETEETEVTEEEETVEVTEPTENETTDSEVEEGEPNLQTAEQNREFARQRREAELQQKVFEAEQRGRDLAIAALGMEWNGKPITTEAEYKKAVEEKAIYDKAIEDNKDPQEALRLKTLEDKVNMYEKQSQFVQQEADIMKSEEFGPIYADHKDEIKGIADSCNCSLDTAMTLYVKENFTKLLQETKKRTEQDTINNLKKNKISSPGALGNSDNNQKGIDFNKMNDKDFEAYVEAVKNGTIR